MLKTLFLFSLGKVFLLVLGKQGFDVGWCCFKPMTVESLSLADVFICLIAWDMGWFGGGLLAYTAL